MLFAIMSQIIESSALWLLSNLLSGTKVKMILIFSQNDITRWCGLFQKSFLVRIKTENSAVLKNKDSAENSACNGSTFSFIYLTVWRFKILFRSFCLFFCKILRRYYIFYHNSNRNSKILIMKNIHFGKA